MDQAPYKTSSEPEGPKKQAKKTAKAASLTPMMAQFFEIKAINPGFLLFYRMGDFYELFFEDAQIAAAALGIALTTRGTHMGEEIPMCGVPVRAHRNYLQKLISFGHRVAICEQMETPAEAKIRGAKSVVRRDVVRLVTSGTLTEDDLLPETANNFLGALAMVRHGEVDFALAWADISTGETFVADIAADRLEDELGRLDLAELILSKTTDHHLRENSLLPTSIVRHREVLLPQNFQSDMAKEILQDTFADIDPSSFTRAACSALGALISYVEKTQKASGVALRTPSIIAPDQQMQIDLATWASLEVLSTNRGEAKGSLRHAIDKTLTGAGARLLSRRLTAPLADPKRINYRLDMVENLFSNTMFRQQISKALTAMPDITRPLTRLCLERGGPRDLAHIAIAIDAAHEVLSQLSAQSEMACGLVDLAGVLEKAPQELAKEIQQTLVERPPLIAREGGFVVENCDEELDHQRELATKSRTIISELQAQLSARCEIKSLKIKHNNMLGFFVEVPASQGQKLLENPFDEIFIHRQTMANAMRFTTAELSELQGKISQAQQISLEIENSIFLRLVEKTVAASDILRRCADALAEMDLTYSLATIAAEHAYCRPVIDNSLAFKISAGRHPVVEQTLGKTGETFVTNDCDLSAIDGGAGDDSAAGDHEQNGGQLWLVTGPNMGG